MASIPPSLMTSFHPYASTIEHVEPTPPQQHTTVFIPQATKAQAPSTSAQASHNTDDVAGYATWSVQWVSAEKERHWTVGNPQFKFCKKRKEFYTDEMPAVWYKAPYKYHMSLEVTNMDENEPVTALLDLQFEDGQRVVYTNKANGKKSKKTPPSSTHELSSGVVSNNENTFHHTAQGKSEVTIGPFTFNCCSYKFDGRKFRLVIYLLNQSGVCCFLYSSPILIRAKKPIVNKGSKMKGSKKRKHSDSEDDTDSEEYEKPEKKQKLAPLQTQNLMVHQSAMQQPMMQQPLLMDVMNAPVLQPPAAPVMGMPMMPVETSTMSSMNFDSNSMFSPPSPSKWYNSSIFLGENGLLLSEKPLTGVEKVQTMVETFDAMDDKDRKELLDKLFERATYPEREYIKRKFFSSTWESMPANNNPSTTTSTNTSNQPSTSNDVDGIFNNIMNW